MREDAAQAVTGTRGVRATMPVEIVFVDRPAGDPARKQPVPGVDVFDSVELSAGVAVPQAYARFTVHSKTGVVKIEIVDARTNEVIREIPPEAVLKIAEQLQAYLDARKAKGA